MADKLYRWNHWFGRMGDLKALFLEDEEVVKANLGRTAYFGEALGKHSDVYCSFVEEDLEVVTDDQEFLAKFKEYVGAGTISGHNPLDYMDDDEDEE